MKLTDSRVAVATNAIGAIAVFLTSSGQVWPLRYAPSALGKPENAQAFKTLFKQAAEKLVARG